jgi:hypothetical protein
MALALVDRYAGYYTRLRRHFSWLPEFDKTALFRYLNTD